MASLHDFFSWSLRVGRLYGVVVRLHIIFVLWIASDLLRASTHGGVGRAAASLGFLFGVVLLHEFGHCFAARRVGGHADEVLLWPLGGLAMVSVPPTPLAHLVTALGGPAVNVVILLLLLPFQLWSGQPLGSYFLGTGDGSGALGMMAAVNLDLLLFNLLPAFPLDGGRVLHSLVWMTRGRWIATRVALFTSRIAGGGMAAIGLVRGLSAGFDPGASNLLFIGLFILVSGEQELRRSDQEETEPSYLEPRLGWFERMRLQAAQRRSERAARARAAREQLVDALLEKVSRHGLDSLSEREKRLLKDASSHYRKR